MSRVKVRITGFLEKVYKVRHGITVGRDPKNSIQLLAQSVSRNHAQFLITGEAVTIVDLGSSNGTKVNGERVHETQLKDGDVIEICGIMLIFEKEVAHVAEENIFVLEGYDMSEEQIKSMADRSELGLVLPSDPDMVDLAYSISHAYLDRVELVEDDNVNMLTALYEAMDNARRHGNVGDPAKKIKLFFMDLPDKVTLAVVDEGDGFDYATILEKSREQDALSAARERYMAGGMGGLGIRLMLKCADKIEYEHEGAKITLSKFKKPLEPEEMKEKMLTKEEQIYKTTLWDEIQKAEKEMHHAHKDGDAHAPREKREADAEDSAARPAERVKHFEDRLSQFFLLDSRDGLKGFTAEQIDKELKRQEGEQKEEAKSDSGDDLQVNLPDHIPPDEQDSTEKDKLDLDL